ncbi:MAG: HNH endonuclease, partial [Ktedonobacteraceae bacterium]
MVSQQVKQQIFGKNRNHCAICGSTVKQNLEIAHISPLTLGRSNTPDNFILFCSVCHWIVYAIDLPPPTLNEVRDNWVEKGVLGREQIIDTLADRYENAIRTSGGLPSYPIPSLRSIFKWLEALSEKRTFDDELSEAKKQIKAQKNEDDFINNVLRPIFVFLGFDGITVLHHSGNTEYGKDIVFYQRDALGSFIFYAVVACNTRIHALSSKTNASGHYDKIIDQVN